MGKKKSKEQVEIDVVYKEESTQACELVPIRFQVEESMEHIADMTEQFSQTMDPILKMYSAAMSATTARLEIIEDEFRYRKLRCPIHHIDTRLKSAKSILGMALGALQAIDAAGRTVGTDIYLVGVDALSEALENVISGKMTGTVFNDHFSQSHSAADAAIKFLNGETNEYYIGCDYVKVTTDNAQEILDMVK